MYRLAALPILLALAGPGLAQRVTEPGTGLSVDPPVPYHAALTTARPPNTVAISVRRPEDTDTGCQVAWRPAPANERFTQEQLNVAMGGPAWRGEVIRGLEALYTVELNRRFQHAGIDGFLLEGMVRMRPGIPARGKDIRTLFVVLETPRGRTSAVCVGETASFAQRRDEFLAIIRSTTPPTQPPGRATGGKV